MRITPIILILIALVWVLVIAVHAQPLPDASPAPKFKKVSSKTVASSTLAKPATQMLAVRPPPKPIQFIAVSRGPSPYDEMANVETILVGKIQIDNSVQWEILQRGQTNRFIVANTNQQQFFNMTFGFTPQP